MRSSKSRVGDAVAAAPPAKCSRSFSSALNSFALCLPYLNFLAHSRHNTTLTKADFLTPCSTYPNGISSSSNLASTRGVSESGSARGGTSSPPPVLVVVVKIEEEEEEATSSAC